MVASAMPKSSIPGASHEDAVTCLQKAAMKKRNGGSGRFLRLSWDGFRPTWEIQNSACFFSDSEGFNPWFTSVSWILVGPKFGDRIKPTSMEIMRKDRGLLRFFLSGNGELSAGVNLKRWRGTPNGCSENGVYPQKMGGFSIVMEVAQNGCFFSRKIPSINMDKYG